jgi:hypothetical protein
VSCELCLNESVVANENSVPHYIAHKYTWTSLDLKTHFPVDHIMIADSSRVYVIPNISE